MQILFNPNKSDTVETIGVEYEQFGEICQVYAKYETVISAGAVGSPKLLMLSGIGPKNHLSKLKVCKFIHIFICVKKVCMHVCRKKIFCSLYIHM